MPERPLHPDTQSDVIVLKFGGSSVGTPGALRQLIRIVKEEATTGRPVIVVSALGGVTDRLLSLARGTEEPAAGIADLRERHLCLAGACLVPPTRSQYEAILDWHLVMLNDTVPALRAPDRDRVLAIGERLSAPLVALALSEAGLTAETHDAAKLIRVRDTPTGPVVDWRHTRETIRTWYAGVTAVPVVTGFIAGTARGEVRTLGRGGSDYSAALLAAALHAGAMERWTDVDGLYTEDPHRHPGARHLRFLAMEEAHTLNRSGGLGMHPAVFQPLLAEGIPLRVRCTTRPARHTLVLGSRKAPSIPPPSPHDPFHQPQPATTMNLSTHLTLAGQQTDRCYNSIVPPIYQTANFRFEAPGVTRGYDYSRSGNPTRRALEETLAVLEGGAGAVALTSGMAAIATTLSLFDAGAHIICSHDCYGGTARLLLHYQRQGKLQVSFVDLTCPGALRHAIGADTRAVWVETPSNPLLRIVDIAGVAAVTREAGLALIVDNTFLSPLLQQPLSLGAHLVVYSTTKYINGHSDVVGGAVIAGTPEWNEQLQYTANAMGTVAQPFDCWLVLRGLKTLPLRLRQHEANAQVVAAFLEAHPRVRTVYYPGLAAHPEHALARRQQRGFGGMVSFAVRGGETAAQDVLRNTRVFALAESLGGVESLIEHPATMSHASMHPEQRLAAGITDDLLRLSVGVEAEEDLLADLGAALERVAEPVSA